MASGSDELSVLEGDDVTISPQDVTRRVNSGEYTLKKKDCYIPWRTPNTVEV